MARQLGSAIGVAVLVALLNEATGGDLLGRAAARLGLLAGHRAWAPRRWRWHFGPIGRRPGRPRAGSRELGAAATARPER